LTTSKRQIIHQDSVKKILPAVHFISKILLAVHSFHQKILPAANFVSYKILSVGHFISVLSIKESCMRQILFHNFFWSVGHFIFVSYSVNRFIGIENDSDSNTQ